MEKKKSYNQNSPLSERNRKKSMDSTPNQLSSSILRPSLPAVDFFDSLNNPWEDHSAPAVRIEYIEDDFIPEFQMITSYGYTGVNPNIVQYYAAVCFIPRFNVAFPVGYRKQTSQANGTYVQARMDSACNEFNKLKQCLGTVYINEATTPGDMPSLWNYLKGQYPPIMYNWYNPSYAQTSDIMDDIMECIDQVESATAHGTGGTLYLNYLEFENFKKFIRRRSNTQAPAPLVVSEPEVAVDDWVAKKYHYLSFYSMMTLQIPNDYAIATEETDYCWKNYEKMQWGAILLVPSKIPDEAQEALKKRFLQFPKTKDMYQAFMEQELNHAKIYYPIEGNLMYVDNYEPGQIQSKEQAMKHIEPIRKMVNKQFANQVYTQEAWVKYITNKMKMDTSVGKEYFVEPVKHIWKDRGGYPPWL